MLGENKKMICSSCEINKSYKRFSKNSKECKVCVEEERNNPTKVTLCGYCLKDIEPEDRQPELKKNFHRDCWSRKQGVVNRRASGIRKPLQGGTGSKK